MRERECVCVCGGVDFSADSQHFLFENRFTACEGEQLGLELLKNYGFKTDFVFDLRLMVVGYLLFQKDLWVVVVG